jgi:toxin ParE1/3/4
LRLRWTAKAASDREAIYQYIAADSLDAAARTDEMIWAAVSSLLTFPEKGRKGRIPGTRELIVQSTPYIAAYRLQGEVVRIVRIRHAAQRWPRTMPHL